MTRTMRIHNLRARLEGCEAGLEEACKMLDNAYLLLDRYVDFSDALLGDNKRMQTETDTLRGELETLQKEMLDLQEEMNNRHEFAISQQHKISTLRQQRNVIIVAMLDILKAFYMPELAQESQHERRKRERVFNMPSGDAMAEEIKRTANAHGADATVLNLGNVPPELAKLLELLPLLQRRAEQRSPLGDALAERARDLHREGPGKSGRGVDPLERNDSNQGHGSDDPLDEDESQTPHTFAGRAR